LCPYPSGLCGKIQSQRSQRSRGDAQSFYVAKHNSVLPFFILLMRQPH
jgi:hypothetical protein